MLFEAVNAFTVSNPREGGQSMKIKSYSLETSFKSSFSTISRLSAYTKSTSAPAKSTVEGITSRRLITDG